MASDDRMIKGYARAIFAVAEAEGDLEDVQDQLFRFGRAVEEQPDLREALTDPGLPSERKKAVVQDLLGGRASKNTISLVDLLLEQGRARDLGRIVHALEELAAERQHEAVAEVRTAVPLDVQRRARLKEALEKATGKEIDLRVLVDDGVIGGVSARVGDEVFDGSVRRKLEIARQQLVGAR